MIDPIQRIHEEHEIIYTGQMETYGHYARTDVREFADESI